MITRGQVIFTVIRRCEAENRERGRFPSAPTAREICEAAKDYSSDQIGLSLAVLEVAGWIRRRRCINNDTYEVIDDGNEAAVGREE